MLSLFGILQGEEAFTMWPSTLMYENPCVKICITVLWRGSSLGHFLGKNSLQKWSKSETIPTPTRATTKTELLWLVNSAKANYICLLSTSQEHSQWSPNVFRIFWSFGNSASSFKVSATLKIVIFSYLRFQRFEIDMLESFLLKKKLEEYIISVERYRG